MQECPHKAIIVKYKETVAEIEPKPKPQEKNVAENGPVAEIGLLVASEPQEKTVAENGPVAEIGLLIEPKHQVKTVAVNSPVAEISLLTEPEPQEKTVAENGPISPTRVEADAETISSSSSKTEPSLEEQNGVEKGEG